MRCMRITTPTVLQGRLFLTEVDSLFHLFVWLWFSPTDVSFSSCLAHHNTIRGVVDVPSWVLCALRVQGSQVGVHALQPPGPSSGPYCPVF